MQILRPESNPDNFFARLANAPRATLLLDYDGTLAPFHVNPLEAIPWPGVTTALDTLQAQHDTRIVIVSGRWTQDLVPLLKLRHLPEIWGAHGWERRFPDGRIEIARPPEQALRGLAEADTWMPQVRALGGRSETKPACLAVHWRGLANEAAAAIRAIVSENWALHARDSGLELHDFDGGVELRVPGRHKGDAVRMIRKEMPDALLAYLGDDLTDEDAFAALGEQDLGVLVRKDLRPATAAGLWITPPEELLAFLQRWIKTRAALQDATPAVREHAT